MDAERQRPATTLSTNLGDLAPVRSVAVIAAPSTAGHVRGLLKVARSLAV